MSRFAICCNPAGRIDAILRDDGEIIGADRIGRMASVCFATAAVPCFYEMLVELEDREVLCGWRLEMSSRESGSESGAGSGSSDTTSPSSDATCWISGARDDECILLVGGRNADPMIVAKPPAVASASPGDADDFGGFVRRAVASPPAELGECGHHLAALAEKLLKRAGDSAAVLADSRLQVAVLERLVAAPEKFENELVRMAAHDLRNPLLVMSMNCSFLLDQNPSLTADDRSLLSDCLEMCDAISRFLDGMRSLVGFSSGQFSLDRRDIDVAGVIRPIVKRGAISATRADIQVVADRIDPVVARVDPDKLSFIVTELLGNAMNFCSAGATVRVSLEVRGDEIAIIVVDDGPGISPEVQRRLFRPFGKPRGHISQSGKPGAGVGLAIIRRIAEAHGGRVEVISAPGAGTRVEIMLPGPLPAPDQ